MNILYVCHRLPYPPKRGGKIRPFNMIRHLQQSGHQVTVASLARSKEELKEGRDLGKHCHRVLVETVNPWLQIVRMVLRLFTLTPSSMGYFYSSRLKRRVADLLAKEKFDFIFVHCSSVAQYVENVQGVSKMLDFGDMDSQKWLIYSKVRPFPLSLGYWLEGTKLLRAEKILARKFNYCSCTTKAELETLNGYGVDVATGWFPNGVDAEYFHEAEYDYDSDTICFVGRMDYFPNQQAMFWFCENVWPVLRAKNSQLKLLIVGANPSDAVKALKKYDGVEVTGSVPDVRPYVHKSALSVAPLFIARGTQNKILECMAMGVPVVTSIEASKGVDAVPGEHLIAADSVADYCDAILDLTANRQHRRQLSQAARERVLSNHDWQASMHRLDKHIESCMTQPVDSRQRSRASVVNE